MDYILLLNSAYLYLLYKNECRDGYYIDIYIYWR